MKSALWLIPALAGALWLARDRSTRAAGDEDARDVASTTDAGAVADDADVHADCTAERDRLLARIDRLEGRLASMQAESLAREEQWVDYNRMIVSIAPEDLFPELHAEKVQAALADAEPPPPDPAVVALEERSAAIRDSLVALFRAEGIDRFDLLELGLVGDGAIGPVLLRSFDDRGRAIGTLTAARLRLEGSRAGLTLTIVLEDGYTRRAGERVAFPGTEDGAERGGVYRLVLPHTDPNPWANALPELFREDLDFDIQDDGRWNLYLLRRDLNARLDRAALGGRFVLKDVAGVRDGVLRDVAFDELDDAGALRRRIFADRVQVRVDESGVQLLLEDGVAVRGEQKLPFLDGRMRIYLPRADVAEWTDGSLPVADARAVPEAPAAPEGEGDGAEPDGDDASTDGEAGAETALPAGSDDAAPR